MRGRVCLVTGASSGIGRETARGLVRMGARVILVARDRSRGEAARAEIAREPGGGQAELLVADLSSQRALVELAAAVRRTHPRLHVLIHNAAIIPRQREVTVDGLEMQFAVNHMAPFLLTRLLLPLLRASAPARIVVTASQVEARGQIAWEDLQSERNYTPLGAYFQSKLANVLFTYELARRLTGTGVTANCLHPGVIDTNLLCDYLGQRRAVGRLLNRLRYPGPAEGARTTLRLASDPALEGVSGRYFRPEGEALSSPASRDPQAQRRLWQVSEELIRVPLDLADPLDPIA